jgi:2,4-dienoyl-CoA reductase (NADPH2)
MIFEKLFTPITIGNMTLRNRIVMAPMTVDYANADETVSDRQVAYYSERAKGGAGLITLEVCTVDGDHRYQAKSLGLYSDDQIPSHKKLVEAIHAHGAKVVPQLSHTGPESLAPFFKGMPPVGPSVVRTQTTLQVCRELSADEIPALVSLYGDAAVRAKAAGYDGIELHAAHSYMLLGSFMSPLRNHRTDAYAGRKLEGRMKLLMEVLTDIRSKVGSDFPIILRISGYERESGGREINDTQRMAPALVQAGVSAFHVSGGVGDNNITQIIPGSEQRSGLNVSAAAAIRQVVDVPVMVVGRNMDVKEAEAILLDESADLVVMGRALFADPDLPNKAQAGQLSAIRRCTSCEDCVDTIFQNIGVKCAINAQCGREIEFPSGLSASAKKVLVIGGGPAGMEAARMAAERGHAVTLMEKSAQLGGRFAVACGMLRENHYFLDFLRAEMQRLPIEIRLNAAATVESVTALSPDAVIVATGAQAQNPLIDGSVQPHVLQSDALYTLLANRFEGNALGQRIAIIGSGIMAVEMAELLATQGKRVAMISSDQRLAGEVGKKRRGEESRRLDAAGVIVNTGVTIHGIIDEGVQISMGDTLKLVKADNVLLVDVMQADTTLMDQLQGVAPSVQAIGDCTGFGLVKKAVEDAVKAVYALG